MNLGDLTRFLNPIKRQIFLLIGKAILTKVNNVGKTGFHDSGTRPNPQRIDINWFGQLTDIERAQPYGFETYPKADTAKCVLVSPDGSRSNAFVIMVQDDEYRPTDLIEGDVCLYDKDDARIKCSGGKVAIGNKDNGNELLDLFDKLLTELLKPVDLTGTASTGKLFKIETALQDIQAKLATIKGTI